MSLADQYQKAAALAALRRCSASQPGQTSRQVWGNWMLRPLALGLFAAFLVNQLQGHQRNVRPVSWAVYSGGAVYSVETVVVGLQRRPDRWLGRAVWVRGAWESLCLPPGEMGGCVMGMPGQSMYWLAGRSGATLPLEDIDSDGNFVGGAGVPGASYPTIVPGQIALFRVRLAWLGSGLCPWTGPDPDSEGTPSTVPCRGAKLQL